MPEESKANPRGSVPTVANVLAVDDAVATAKSAVINVDCPVVIEVDDAAIVAVGADGDVTDKIAEVVDVETPFVAEQE